MKMKSREQGIGNREQGMFLKGIARGLLAIAMVAVGLTAFAAEPDPLITLGEMKSHVPWNGKFDVEYTLKGLESGVDYKVAFDVTADSKSMSVTNAAAKLANGTYTNTLDTTELFGKEVVDTKAKVKVTLIAIKPKSAGVQLWENGPLFAQCNVGGTVPEDYGELYTFNDNKAKDAAASLGDGWRLPTKSELESLLSNCTKKWETCKDSTGADINGYRFTGNGDYSSNSIFLPAAGYGTGNGRNFAGVLGYYWSSEPDGDYVCDLTFVDGNAIVANSVRSHGLSVRAVRDAGEGGGGSEEVVATAEKEFRLGPKYAPGSEKCPWQVGTTGHEGEVTAYTNGVGGLVVEGAGAVGSMPWAESPAGITELVKDKGVTGLEGVVATLPALTTVNGLTLNELNGLAVGVVKVHGFSAIAVDPVTQSAELDVVISRADSLEEPVEWTPVATNVIPVKAEGPAGFFIVAPAVK